MVSNLSDNEVGRVAALALFDTHYARELFPHAVLPFEVVLLHALVIITLAALADTGCPHLRQVRVDVARDEVVVLVSLVAETEDDILETLELVLSVGELEALIGEVLAEGNGVVGGLALTVGGHDEERAAIFRDLVEVLEVILLGVTDKGGKAELLLGFLGKADSILLRSASLRAVEDDDALFLGPRCIPLARCETCQTCGRKLTPSFIFATKSRGFPPPAFAFEEVTGTDLGLDPAKSWSRKR